MHSATHLDSTTVPSPGLPEASPLAGGDSMEAPTRLEAFMKANKITPVALARTSGITRQHLLQLRNGKAEPGRAVIAAIVEGCRKLSDKPIKPTDLFDLGGE